MQGEVATTTNGHMIKLEKNQLYTTSDFCDFESAYMKMLVTMREDGTSHLLASAPDTVDVELAVKRKTVWNYVKPRSTICQR